MNLRDLRESKFLTMMQVSKAAKVPYSTIFRIEIGEREPRLGTALKLSIFYGISLEKFADLFFSKH